jgi:hypothetical protein
MQKNPIKAVSTIEIIKGYLPDMNLTNFLFPRVIFDVLLITKLTFLNTNLNAFLTEDSLQDDYHR